MCFPECEKAKKAREIIRAHFDKVCIDPDLRDDLSEQLLCELKRLEAKYP